MQGNAKKEIGFGDGCSSSLDLVVEYYTLDLSYKEAVENSNSENRKSDKAGCIRRIAMT